MKAALQSLIVSMRSTHTTYAGIVFGGALLMLAVFRPLTEGKPLSETQELFAVTGLGLVTSGLLARDGSKTSEDVGAKENKP